MTHQQFIMEEKLLTRLAQTLLFHKAQSLSRMTHEHHEPLTAARTAMTDHRNVDMIFIATNAELRYQIAELARGQLSLQSQLSTLINTLNTLDFARLFAVART